MTDDRSYRCPSCHGVVAIPDKWRRVDLDAVQRVHEQTCPRRGVILKEADDGAQG